MSDRCPTAGCAFVDGHYFGHSFQVDDGDSEGARAGEVPSAPSGGVMHELRGGGASGTNAVPPVRAEERGTSPGAVAQATHFLDEPGDMIAIRLTVLEALGLEGSPRTTVLLVRELAERAGLRREGVRVIPGEVLATSVELPKTEPQTNNGPCGREMFGMPGAHLTCMLVAGHAGDHRDGEASWREPRQRTAEAIRKPTLCSAGCHLECNACAAKPGSPTLCAGCLAARTACNASRRERDPAGFNPEERRLADELAGPNARAAERAKFALGPCCLFGRCDGEGCPCACHPSSPDVRDPISGATIPDIRIKWAGPTPSDPASDISWCLKRADLPDCPPEAKAAIGYLARHLECARLLLKPVVQERVARSSCPTCKRPT